METFICPLSKEPCLKTFLIISELWINWIKNELKWTMNEQQVLVGATHKYMLHINKKFTIHVEHVTCLMCFRRISSCCLWWLVSVDPHHCSEQSGLWHSCWYMVSWNQVLWRSLNGSLSSKNHQPRIWCEKEMLVNSTGVTQITRLGMTITRCFQAKNEEHE